MTSPAAAQDEVRALLDERFCRGIGSVIAHKLGVSRTAVYRFHGGRGTFPPAKLDALRAFLLSEAVDRQGTVRALFVACLAQKRVRSSDVVRRFAIQKAAVSRFKNGFLPFPAAKLDALHDFLEARMNGTDGEPLDAPRLEGAGAPHEAPLRGPRARRAASSRSRVDHVEAALVAIATRFGWSLVEAALRHATAEDFTNSGLEAGRSPGPTSTS